MYTDPIADMLTRIRNAQSARKPRTTVPASRLKKDVLAVLKQYGFIAEFAEEANGAAKTLVVTLPTDRQLTITRVSKPGQRTYRPADELKSVKNGLGISVISTSAGVMSHVEAKKKGIGGEVICEIY